MNRDQTISIIYLIAVLLLLLAYACVAKHKQKKNWHLVRGKYVRSSTEHLAFVVAFCELFPCVLLAKGLFWPICVGVALCLLLLILPIMRNPRVEVCEDALLVRNTWRDCKTIPYSRILSICSTSYKNNTRILLSVQGEPHRIQVAMANYAGLPELLAVLAERCPGAVVWEKLPPELKKRTLDQQ